MLARLKGIALTAVVDMSAEKMDESWLLFSQLQRRCSALEYLDIATKIRGVWE